MNIQSQIIPIEIEKEYKLPATSTELFQQFHENFNKAISKAENQLIQQIQEELHIEEKCAIYFINRHFNVTLQINTPDRIDETPTFEIVAEPKTIEEILNRSDDEEMNMECEKQLLENKNYD